MESIHAQCGAVTSVDGHTMHCVKSLGHVKSEREDRRRHYDASEEYYWADEESGITVPDHVPDDFINPSEKMFHPDADPALDRVVRAIDAEIAAMDLTKVKAEDITYRSITVHWEITLLNGTVVTMYRSGFCHDPDDLTSFDEVAANSIENFLMDAHFGCEHAPGPGPVRLYDTRTERYVITMPDKILSISPLIEAEELDLSDHRTLRSLLYSQMLEERRPPRSAG